MRVIGQKNSSLDGARVLIFQGIRFGGSIPQNFNWKRLEGHAGNEMELKIWNPEKLGLAAFRFVKCQKSQGSFIWVELTSEGFFLMNFSNPICFYLTSQTLQFLDLLHSPLKLWLGGTILFKRVQPIRIWSKEVRNILAIFISTLEEQAENISSSRKANVGTRIHMQNK